VWRSRSTIRIGLAVGLVRKGNRPAAGIDAEIDLNSGQDVMDRRIEPDLALLDQHHEGEAGDRLGHRGDAEQRASSTCAPPSRAGPGCEKWTIFAVACDKQLGVGSLPESR
jgi:hypothetical protein